MKLIDKDALAADLEKLRKSYWESFHKGNSTEEQYYIRYGVIQDILSSTDTLEVIDPYEQIVQYDSIKAGIQAHAEIYSFNIESELFPQLTKEQQALWRKEIEQAVISGGEMGVGLARDPRYKENLEVKEVDLEKDVRQIISLYYEGIKYYEDVIRKEREENGGSDLAIKIMDGVVDARELGIQYVMDKLKAQKGEEL